MAAIHQVRKQEDIVNGNTTSLIGVIPILTLQALLK